MIKFCFFVLESIKLGLLMWHRQYMTTLLMILQYTCIGIQIVKATLWCTQPNPIAHAISSHGRHSYGYLILGLGAKRPTYTDLSTAATLCSLYKKSFYDRGEYITLFPNNPFGKSFQLFKLLGRVSCFTITRTLLQISSFT